MYFTSRVYPYSPLLSRPISTAFLSTQSINIVKMGGAKGFVYLHTTHSDSHLLDKTSQPAGHWQRGIWTGIKAERGDRVPRSLPETIFLLPGGTATLEDGHSSHTLEDDRQRIQIMTRLHQNPSGKLKGIADYLYSFSLKKTQSPCKHLGILARLHYNSFANPSIQQRLIIPAMNFSKHINWGFLSPAWKQPPRGRLCHKEAALCICSEEDVNRPADLNLFWGR